MAKLIKQLEMPSLMFGGNLTIKLSVEKNILTYEWKEMLSLRISP